MRKERLVIKNVSKVFPGVIALSDVSMSLYEGEILSLCGENGAGKSTLMKILSGTHTFGTYTGEIQVDGKILELHTVTDAEKHGIGIIPQELNIQLDMTVAENVMLGHWPHLKNGLIDWKTLRQESVKALENLNVSIDPNMKMRSLNASMQQLVCIARTLILNPAILILDEPTAALTPGETENLMKILRDLRKKSISCIYISHKLEEVFDISDRIIVMRNGQIVSNYPRERIEPANVIRDMIGREMDNYYPTVEKDLGGEVFRVEHLTVPHPSAPNKNIVDNVDFSLRKGEIVGLAGLVGSGRSELLKSLCGALPRSDGCILIDNKEYNIKSPRDAIRAGLFMVSEDRKSDGYVPGMSIRENMTMSILGKC